MLATSLQAWDETYERLPSRLRPWDPAADLYVRQVVFDVAHWGMGHVWGHAWGAWEMEQMGD